MSDQFQNPFLNPNPKETPSQNQPQAPQQGQQVPQQVQGQQLQAQQMQAQPAGQQPQAPIAPQMQNPFQQPQQPQMQQPQMQQPQPQQPQMQQPQQPQMQQPQMQQPQNPFQQTSPQFQRPQNVVRESASNYQSNVKKPSPFDFANQSGAGGATSAPQQTDGGRLRYHGLVFSGGVGEYYGVVILNYLLTLITLGIYAPWAKVRKERYFHSHTEFLDEGFQYLATGKQLLAGRAVAFVLLIALSMAELIPYVGVAISILFVLVALPFILNRSVRFKARNVAWRDVRFGWHGGLGMAILVWMIYPVLSFVTLGLAQPLAARALRRHYADNHAFGGASFSADLGLGAFYAALGKAVFFALFLLALFGGIGGFIAYSLLGDMLVSVSSYEELVLILAILPDEQKAYLALPFIGIAFALFMSGQYYFALVRHVMVNHLRLQGGIRFRSQLSGFKFAMLMLSNLLINIISLGFAHPYTIIRRYRYLVQAIEIRPIADMAGFVDTQTKAGFSVFEEASDIEGLSIDI